MSRRYTKEMTLFIFENYQKYTLKQLVEEFNMMFDDCKTYDGIGLFLRRNNLKAGIKATKIRKHFIGSERMCGGYIFIKYKESEIPSYLDWKPKSRYMYEKYHNVELTENEYVLFIDGDKFNFAKENLKLITKNEIIYYNSLKVMNPTKEINEVKLNLAKINNKINKFNNKERGNFV